MADTSKINEILNYYGLKTNIEETKKWVKQYVGDALTGITTDLMISGTYEQIKGWRDNSELKPGMLYRMTDYVTNVYSEDGSVSSAEHPFDLILFADSVNALNENAFAVLHDGDEYFNNSKLNAWEIKYSLDNDDNRFDYLKSVKNYEALEYINDDDLPYFYYHIPKFTIDGNYIYTHVDEISDIDSFEEWLDNVDEGNIDFATSFMIPEGSLILNDPIEIPFDNVHISEESIRLSDNTVGPVIHTREKEREYNYFYDNNTGNRLLRIFPTNAYTISENNLYVLNDGYDDETTTLYYFSSEELTQNTVLYTGVLDHEERNPRSRTYSYYYNLTETDIRMVDYINTVVYESGYKPSTINPVALFKESIISADGKGVIYYMKDEFNNEAPFDFKNILQKDGEYTFGNNGEDYSLNGYANGVYNNKILPCVNSETGKQTINKIRVTGEDCNTNIFKPTCVNSYIDFPISECDISMNDDGELVIFKPQDFISGIENHTIEHDYKKDYLTFEAVNGDTQIIFKTYVDDSQYTRTIEVSKDKVNWESKTSSSEGVILATLNAGECLYLRGNNSSYGYYYEGWDEYLPNFILPLNDCYVYGNVMSLIDSNNFRTLTEITDDYALYSLFCNYWGSEYSGEYVWSHPDKKLELPATTLANNCYSSMFKGCTSLTTAPSILPATTLANWCYNSMFAGCTSLVTAPVLPATTLANWCYNSMFAGCTSLVTAPVLPATTLAESCYIYMFYNCTSLTTAPELPATTLVTSCYQGMFQSCSSLNYIKCLAINNINTNNSTSNWVQGVQTNSGTFVKHPFATGWDTCSSNGIPCNWTVEDIPVQVDNYITFTALENNVPISLSRISSYQKLWYSTDDGETWNNFTTGATITLENSGDTCYFAGLLSGNNTSSNYTQFNLPNRVSVGGNINSLWNYMDLNQDLYQYCGYYLFNGCTGLVNASGLTLGTSATTLADYCYNSMFESCYSLTTAPELPETTLANYCYMGIFRDCTSLTTAPELPATRLAYGCYEGMFENCYSLTTAPELPATTLARSCYSGMFTYCSSLTTAPSILPATTLANNCYQGMFDNCTSLTSAPSVLPATTLANYCYYTMFQGCSSLTTAPVLPATTLATSCYSSMFAYCSSLNYIKCLAINGINTNNSTTEWVDGVQTNSGTFVKHPDATSWTTGNNGIPFNWTVEVEEEDDDIGFDLFD